MSIKIGIGLKIAPTSTPTPPVVWDANYLAVYNAQTTKPNDAEKTAYNTFVKTFVNAGEWTKYDRVFVFEGHINTADESLLDWKAPTTAGRKASLISTPTFTARLGFTGDGIGKAINSNFVPSTDGVNYTKDSCSIVAFTRANKAGENGVLCGCNDTDGLNGLKVYTRYTDDKMYHYMHSTIDIFLSYANADARGFFASLRTNATTINYHKDGVDHIGNQNSVKLPDKAIGVLVNAAPVNAIWAKDQISILMFGSGTVDLAVARSAILQLNTDLAAI